MIPLEGLTPCFQGLIPAWLCTCSADGVPNAAILSHVDYVDSRHVALSFQFFNKSRRNIAENPKAMVRLLDPDTMRGYRLRLRYVRTETEGALFDSMRLRIEAVASYSGLKGIFQLLGADIYEVLAVEAIEWEPGIPQPPPTQAAASGDRGALFTMRALEELSGRLHAAPCLDALLDAILESLEQLFGFRHSMLLLVGDQPERLELIAQRGYAEGGVGSEVGFGDGIIGMTAEARKPIRIAGMLRQLLYAEAVRKRARESGHRGVARRIPLPGLASPESQLGIPLLARDELLGVLCIESERPYRFHEEDRAYLGVLGGYLALAIQNALLRERADAAGRAASPVRSRRARKSARRLPRLRVEYYESEECVLVDGEYLVRSLPARILWKLLREHAAGGEEEFTNRRLRLDPALKLPDFKDNLEARLILLRRRLEERCPAIRLVPSGRGRFRLELRAELELVARP